MKERIDSVDPARLERVAAAPRLRARPVDGHKGLFGRVLVVGGSEGMLGAPSLAGAAALRMGSGLVQLAVPRSILQACLTLTPELIGMALGKASGKDALLVAAEKADAIVVGPGMGRSSEAHARVVCLVRLDKPMVLDADALNILSEEKRWPSFFKARAVLTPHPGEMGRLNKLMGRGPDVPTDDEGRIELATTASRAFGQVIVLKGHRTVVADGRRVYVNDTGDSTLSKAGAGDVLSGIIGCLLGQTVEPFEAAMIGVRLHGLAGEIAGKKWGRRGALARDVIEAIPEAARQENNECRNSNDESMTKSESRISQTANLLIRYSSFVIRHCAVHRTPILFNMMYPITHTAARAAIDRKMAIASIVV